VERLVARILALSPTGEVLLHHDPRIEPMVWSESPGRRVHVIEPQPMDWGGFTMVEATLRVLAQLDEDAGYDWCALISGQDYPVRDLAKWEDEMSDGADYLLRSEEVPFDPALPRRTLVRDEYYVRYAYRWRPLGRVPARAVPVANTLARIVGAGPLLLTRPFKGRLRLGIARRTPFGPGWRCFKGSQWMALSARSVTRILRVLSDRPELTTYYATTLVPDESLLQTVLGNQSDLSGRPERLTFTTWAGSGAAHPTLLRSADVDAVLASGCPFARKFDIDIDEAALTAIDGAVGRGNPGALGDPPVEG
jgi:hypothetical protein